MEADVLQDFADTRWLARSQPLGRYEKIGLAVAPVVGGIVGYLLTNDVNGAVASAALPDIIYLGKRAFF